MIEKLAILAKVLTLDQCKDLFVAIDEGYDDVFYTMLGDRISAEDPTFFGEDTLESISQSMEDH